MHILLTDILTCPRCGPDFGLILLADRLEGREVVEGSLGCANCREQYRISDRIADLRVGVESTAEPQPDTAAEEPAAELAMRYAALLGVAEGPATVLLAGVEPAVIAEMRAIVEGVQLIAAATGEPPARVGSGWLRVGHRLPIRGRSLRGVVLAGPVGDALTAEGARTLAPGARIVLDRPAAGASELLVKAGLSTILEQDGVVVAVSG
jgi:uncharacterized protein YbaR (Trm112 family)